jgi:predicted RNase H-like HicB family nuclease
MLYSYPACIYKNEYGYNIVFPDLEDLGITGSSLEYALQFAKEDLEAYIKLQLATHQKLPAATPLDQIDPDKIAQGLYLPFEILKADKQEISVEF